MTFDAPVGFLPENALLTSHRCDLVVGLSWLGQLAMVVGGIWQLRTPFVAVATVVGACGAFAENQFEDGLEGRNAGGDYDNVRFDAAPVRCHIFFGRTGLTWST